MTWEYPSEFVLTAGSIPIGAAFSALLLGVAYGLDECLAGWLDMRKHNLFEQSTSLADLRPSPHCYRDASRSNYVLQTRRAV